MEEKRIGLKTKILKTGVSRQEKCCWFLRYSHTQIPFLALEAVKKSFPAKKRPGGVLPLYVAEARISGVETPKKEIKDFYGSVIDVGVISHWENEVEGLKGDQDALNEFYRQFPRTEEHAFRDETKNSIFNLAKIYEQIDYNDEIANLSQVTVGSFTWKNGIKDTEVQFTPNPNGRFKISWVPSVKLQNNIIIKKNI